MRYPVLSVLILLGASWLAQAATNDQAAASINVVVERYVDIRDLTGIDVSIEQDGASLGFNAPDNGVIATVTGPFKLWKNCDVVITIPWTLHLRHTGADLLNSGDANLNDPDCLQSQVDLSEDGVHRAVGTIVGDYRQYLAKWVNCTENHGEDWWLWLDIDRTGLCDHAGVYRGTLTISAVAYGL